MHAAAVIGERRRRVSGVEQDGDGGGGLGALRTVAKKDAYVVLVELRHPVADLIVRDADGVGERHPGTRPADAGVDDSGALLDEADEFEFADGLNVGEGLERLNFAPRCVDQDKVGLVVDRQWHALRVGVAVPLMPHHTVDHA